MGEAEMLRAISLALTSEPLSGHFYKYTNVFKLDKIC